MASEHSGAILGRSHECVLYAGMKHVTIVVFHMPNVDVCECINDIKVNNDTHRHQHSAYEVQQLCYKLFIFILVELYIPL